MYMWFLVMYLNQMLQNRPIFEAYLPGIESLNYFNINLENCGVLGRFCWHTVWLISQVPCTCMAAIAGLVRIKLFQHNSSEIYFIISLKCFSISVFFCVCLQVDLVWMETWNISDCITIKESKKIMQDVHFFYM